MGRRKTMKGRFLGFSKQQSKFIARPHNQDSSEAFFFRSMIFLCSWWRHCYCISKEAAMGKRKEAGCTQKDI